MRPVDKKWKTTFAYNARYPDSLKYLTKDGRHEGIDLGTPIGTPVWAGVNGQVYGREWHKGFGLSFWVLFRSSNIDYLLILAHLSKITSNKDIGEGVVKTEIIGYSGDSGSAQGHPHIHVECRKKTAKGWVVVDPSLVVGKA